VRQVICARGSAGRASPKRARDHRRIFIGSGRSQSRCWPPHVRAATAPAAHNGRRAAPRRKPRRTPTLAVSERDPGDRAGPPASQRLARAGGAAYPAALTPQTRYQRRSDDPSANGVSSRPQPRAYRQSRALSQFPTRGRLRDGRGVSGRHGVNGLLVFGLVAGDGGGRRVASVPASAEARRCKGGQPNGTLRFLDHWNLTKNPIAYRVCISGPASARRPCRSAMAPANARPSVLPVFVRCCGEFVARWYVDAHLVAAWPFRFVAER